MTDKQKILQLKTAILNELRELESRAAVLRGQLKSVNKDLDELNNKKQGRLF